MQKMMQTGNHQRSFKHSPENHVTVIGEDTDILNLLSYHSSKNIFIQSDTQSDNVCDSQDMKKSKT